MNYNLWSSNNNDGKSIISAIRRRVSPSPKPKYDLRKKEEDKPINLHKIKRIAIIIGFIFFLIVMVKLCGVSATESGAMRNFMVTQL